MTIVLPLTDQTRYRTKSKTKEEQEDRFSLYNFLSIGLMLQLERETLHGTKDIYISELPPLADVYMKLQAHNFHLYIYLFYFIIKLNKQSTYLNSLKQK